MAVLTLDEAERIAGAALRRAAANALAMSVCIVDPHGVPLCLKRMDAAEWATARIAEAKAFTAAAFGGFLPDTAAMFDRMPRSGFWTTAPALFPGSVAYGAGGLRIDRGGVVIGAIGVSGGNGSEDLDVARAGLAALG
jgi:uncharacterized protein GlcG (DUF336 family)